MPLIATRGGASAAGFGFCNGGAWRRVVLRNSATMPIVTAGGGTIIAWYTTLGFTYRSTDGFVTNSSATVSTGSLVTNIRNYTSAYVGTQHLYVNGYLSPANVYSISPSTGGLSTPTSVSGSGEGTSNVQTDGSYYYVGAETAPSSGTYRLYRSGTAALDFSSYTNESLPSDFGGAAISPRQMVYFNSDVYATPAQEANSWSIYRRNGSTTWSKATTFTSGTVFSWIAANSSNIVTIASTNAGATKTIYSSTGGSFTSRLVSASSTVDKLFWGGDAWYAYNSAGFAYSSPDGTTWGLNSITIASGDVLGQGAANGNTKCIPFSNSGAGVSGVYVKS